jgi:hypothetical protein
VDEEMTVEYVEIKTKRIGGLMFARNDRSKKNAFEERIADRGSLAFSTTPSILRKIFELENACKAFSPPNFSQIPHREAIITPSDR